MARIEKNRGQYNICSTEDQWCVKVFLPEGAPRRVIDETWNLNDEPNIEGLLPSEVVEMIAARVESYLISSGREATRKVIEWCRENASRLDSDWATGRIAEKRALIEKLEKEIKSLSYCLEEQHQLA